MKTHAVFLINLATLAQKSCKVHSKKRGYSTDLFEFAKTKSNFYRNDISIIQKTA